ncbi:hypothetical protein BXP25_15110 [Mycobacterium tuberculosis variant bovis]|nr:hypothetical protein BXP25_15110 [Mycobacterium tuberculosis variant bovis]
MSVSDGAVETRRPEAVWVDRQYRSRSYRRTRLLLAGRSGVPVHTALGFTVAVAVCTPGETPGSWLRPASCTTALRRLTAVATTESGR